MRIRHVHDPDSLGVSGDHQIGAPVGSHIGGDIHQTAHAGLVQDGLHAADDHAQGTAVRHVAALPVPSIYAGDRRRYRVGHVQHPEAVAAAGQGVDAAAGRLHCYDVPGRPLQSQAALPGRYCIHGRGYIRVGYVQDLDLVPARHQSVGAPVRGGDGHNRRPRNDIRAALPGGHASHVRGRARIRQVDDMNAGRIVGQQGVDAAAGRPKYDTLVDYGWDIPPNGASDGTVQRAGHDRSGGIVHVYGMDAKVPGHQGVRPAVGSIKDVHIVHTPQQVDAALPAPQDAGQGGGAGVCDIHHVDAPVVVGYQEIVTFLGMPEDCRADGERAHLKTIRAVAQDAGGDGSGRVGHFDDLQALLAGGHRVDAAIGGMQHLHLPDAT